VGETDAGKPGAESDRDPVSCTMGKVVSPGDEVVGELVGGDAGVCRRGPTFKRRMSCLEAHLTDGAPIAIMDRSRAGWEVLALLVLLIGA
jgi:hypothetical protein